MNFEQIKLREELREKQIARLNGRSVRENDPNVSELLEDVSQHLKIIDDKDAQIGFLMDNLGGQATVSYTHLTLPTICSV